MGSDQKTVPVLLMDIVGFTSRYRRREAKRATLERLQKLLDEIAAPFLPFVDDPWQVWDRHGTGDGYYLVFTAHPPAVAAEFARRLGEALEVGAAAGDLALRMVLDLGDVERVGDQLLSDAFCDAARLIDDQRLRASLEVQSKPWALAMGHFFHDQLHRDAKRDSFPGLVGLDGLWSPMTVVDKHGDRHDGFVLGPAWPTGEAPAPKTTGSKPWSHGVFLCHHTDDKPLVKKIAQELRAQGLKPWLDEWELRPGVPWQPELEAQLEGIAAAAVFVGSNGIGPWQDLEIDAFLRQFVKRRCPVIPVLLPGCPEAPQLPPFLGGMGWVDWGRSEPDPLERLVWGITGENPHSGTTVTQDPQGDRDPKARDDSHPLLPEYLGWVMERTGHLALGGVDPGVANRGGEERLRLGAVYTALRTRQPRRRHGLAGVELGRQEEGQPEEPPLSAVEQLEAHPRLVLLGDPGSGKSTFLNFVALCLAGEALGDSEVNLERLTAPLPRDEEKDAEAGAGEDEGSGEEDRQPWTHGPLLPLRVVLRDFAARGLGADAAGATARDLWQFVVQELEGATLGALAPFLEKALRQGRCVVLLDGLDEVPEAARRRHLLCEAVGQFAQAFKKSRMVLTSRVYAYQKQDFRLPGFAEATLAPFGDGQIRRFVDAWYGQVAELKDLGEDDAQGRAAVLCRAIFQSPRLRELAERPLLLTLMASLHAWRGGSLPERREQLYGEAVELLLDLWERRRLKRNAKGELEMVEPSLGEYLKSDKDALRRLLEELAFEAHAAQPEEQEGTADIPQAELVGKLFRLRTGSEGDPTQLVDYLSQRAGLLEPHGVEVFSFPHRTFQEYLAACHLHHGPLDNDEIAELVKKDPNRWREVLLLAAARSGPKDVWFLVESLLEDTEDTVLEQAWGAQLAGQAAAETANLEQLGKSNRKRLVGLQRRLVGVLGGEELAAAERVVAGESLARLGDPRFDPEDCFLPRQKGAGFVEVPAGVYPQGTEDLEVHEDWPSEVADWPRPVHEVTLSTFYLARFPVTVDQFRAFVEATSFKVEVGRILEGPGNSPVIGVTYDEAREYCAWLTQQLRQGAPRRAEAEPEFAPLWRGLATGGWVVDLPSEAQWEAAARGADGRKYPWGQSEPTAELANFDGSLGRPTPVGAYPKGSGPFGAHEQAGNVWELCRDVWDAEAYKKRVRQAQKDPVVLQGDQQFRVLRGGGWRDPAPGLQAAFRDDWGARTRSVVVGFRVCCAAFEF